MILYIGVIVGLAWLITRWDTARRDRSTRNAARIQEDMDRWIDDHYTGTAAAERKKLFADFIAGHFREHLGYPYKPPKKPRRAPAPEEPAPPAPPEVRGKMINVAYAARYGMTPAAWEELRKQVREQIADRGREEQE